MIKTVQIAGLGPHKAPITLNFNPTGTTEIRGPSECGKTTILDAVTLALWGVDGEGKPFDVARITDGAKAADVKVTLRSGAVAQRRLTASRTWTRSFTDKAGVEHAGLTEEVFRAHLARAGSPAVCVPIMAPFGWVPLYEGANKGRAFRDYLDAALPGDRASDLIAREVGDKEPRTADAAIAARRAAKADEQRAEGARGAARDALDRAKALPRPVVASEEEVGSAREAVATWEADVAAPVVDERPAWRARKAAADAHAERRRAWINGGMTKPEVAKPGEGEAAGLRAEISGLERVLADYKNADLKARDTASVTGRALDSASLALRFAEAEVASAEARVNEAKAAADSVRSCGGVDPGKCRMSANSTATVANAEQAHGVAREKASTAHAAVGNAASAHDTAILKADAAATAVKNAEAKLTEKRNALADVNTRIAEWFRFETVEAARGADPGPAEDVGEEPPAPVRPARPDAAFAVLESARLAADRAAQVQRQIDDAQRALDAAEVALAAATAKRVRAEEVADLVTTAPGRSLRARLGVLNRDGVTVEVDDAGEEITVKVDGRTWGRGVSTGRRILADVSIRDALRVASGVPYLPLFVDEVQSFGARELPALALNGEDSPDGRSKRWSGPVVLLRTGATESGGIEVVS